MMNMGKWWILNRVKKSEIKICKELKVIIKILILILAIFLGLMIHIPTANANDFEPVVVEFKNESKQVVEEPEQQIIEQYSEGTIAFKQNELLHKQKEILCIQDNKEFFLEYKKLIDEYSEWCDPPESIYDCFSEEELNLLFRVVEAEATAGGFDEKANVASVIFNRLEHEKFGDTLNEILIPSQFSPLSDGRAYKVKITEDTILACEYAFMIDDTTDGAIYFEAKGSNVHAAYAEFLFQDSIGHKFYK